MYTHDPHFMKLLEEKFSHGFMFSYSSDTILIDECSSKEEVAQWIQQIDHKNLEKL